MSKSFYTNEPRGAEQADAELAADPEAIYGEYHELQIAHDELFDRCERMMVALRIASEFARAFPTACAKYTGEEVGIICDNALASPDLLMQTGMAAIEEEILSRHAGEQSP